MKRILVVLVLALSGFACTTGGPRISELDALADFDAVMIEPVEVSFAEDWKPYHPNTRLYLGDREMQSIRERLAETFDERFRMKIEREGIKVVDSEGPGTLKISPQLRKVILYAPSPDAMFGSMYIRSVGSMELRAVFSDARSGESLIILLDERHGRDYGHFRRASRPDNEIRLHQIFDEWAEIIAEDMLGPAYASQ